MGGGEGVVRMSKDTTFHNGASKLAFLMALL